MLETIVKTRIKSNLSTILGLAWILYHLTCNVVENLEFPAIWNLENSVVYLHQDHGKKCLDQCQMRQ